MKASKNQLLLMSFSYLSTTPNHPSTYSIIKRTIDILGAIIGLTALILLYIPIAIAIRLDSPGHILYAQTRCGLRGKPFTMYKFRSMVVDAEQQKYRVKNELKGFLFKNANDPRVTRIGRFIRKTSLDELPQFWNVLTGDMSLVGTRPPTVDEVKQYSENHWLRLNVKPGITGEWQVYGRSSVKDFEDVVQLDLSYQKRWSITYDIYIIIKTIKKVLTGFGAC
jgi:exopolysaccharide biosynthesis polyprenyl glycosylphosphotransferase